MVQPTNKHEYVCRDCLARFSTNTPINKCPECSSIYILPADLKIKPRIRKHLHILFTDRLFSLVFGFIAGAVTVYVISIIDISKTRGGVDLIYAFKQINRISLATGGLLGLIGFGIGYDKLLDLLAKIWGSETNSGNKIGNGGVSVPQWLFWVIVILLIIVIIFVYTYLFSHL